MESVVRNPMKRSSNVRFFLKTYIAAFGPPLDFYCFPAMSYV